MRTSRKLKKYTFIGMKKVLLNEIIIPWSMTQSIPKKYDERLNFYILNQKLYRPIELDEKKKLIDGYTSYLILKEYDIAECDAQLYKYNDPNHIRKNKYSIRKIEMILDKPRYPTTIASVTKKKGDTNRTIRMELHGVSIKKYSANIVVFFAKGYDCIHCGIRGSFFALECNGGMHNGFALILYALNTDGKEVLMTVDHIVPKANGGGNNMQNLQPMCVDCNVKKAHYD